MSKPSLIERCFLVALSENGAPMSREGLRSAAVAVAEDVLAGVRCADTLKKQIVEGEHDG